MKILYLLIILICANSVLASDTQKLQRQLADMAKQCQRHQEKVNQEEGKLRDLEAARFQKTEALKKSQKQIDKYIIILQRLKAAQPTAIFNPKMSPQKLVHSLMVLNRFLNNMSTTAKYLKSEVKKLAQVEGEIENNKERLLKDLKTYNKKYGEIEQALKKHKAAIRKEVKRRSGIEKRVNRLASQSMSLHDLIRKLEKEEKETPSKTKRGHKFLDSRRLNNYGKYQAEPISWPIVSNFGQKHKEMDAEGSGLVYRTRQNSYVSSPVHGQVVYAGDFRGYKQIIIIAHDNEYHTLLTGMAQVNVSVGQTVLAGEPMGIMGPKSTEYLYLELRKNGKPINPERWLVK
tara:strand:+ start:8191 stop:9228 length:1038 start_codon:yes stop_codon:yes gene_type:complete